jgi:prepilin-type processing-associated H-X9-DG protein
VYVDDNGFYPLGSSLDSKGWMDRIIPFTNSLSTQFICPVPPFTFEELSRPGVYGYNSMGTVNVFSKPDIQARRFGAGLGGYAMEGVGEVSVPERAVKVPSDMIAFGDGFSGTREGKISWGAFGNNWVGFVRPDEDRTYRQAAQKRHNGKLNVAFCDGHVESVKVHTLLLDHSEASLRRWNNDNEPHRTYILSAP